LRQRLAAIDTEIETTRRLPPSHGELRDTMQRFADDQAARALNRLHPDSLRLGRAPDMRGGDAAAAFAVMVWLIGAEPVARALSRAGLEADPSEGISSDDRKARLAALNAERLAVEAAEELAIRAAPGTPRRGEATPRVVLGGDDELEELAGDLAVFP
jgi:hypothetical protein